MEDFLKRVPAFLRPAKNDQFSGTGLGGGSFLGEATGIPTVFRHKKADLMLPHKCLVQLLCKRPLHRDDVSMGDTAGFACGKCFMRGKNPGKEPDGVENGIGGEMPGSGGQKDVAGPAGQIGRSILRTLCINGVFRGAASPKKTITRDTRSFTGLAYGNRDVGCVGVRCVDAQHCIGKETLFFRCTEWTDECAYSWNTALLLETVFGSHADCHLRTEGMKPRREFPAFRGSAKKENVHREYPLGVTIRPESSLVAEEPINTVVNMSASAS